MEVFTHTHSSPPGAEEEEKKKEEGKEEENSIMQFAQLQVYLQVLRGKHCSCKIVRVQGPVVCHLSLESLDAILA